MTDSDHGHRLHVELLRNDWCVGRVFVEYGKAHLRIDPGQDITVDFDWLQRIAAQLKEDLSGG
ncbi:MAG: hypothetical protein K2X38_20650 [Gemmataceae bacterium]|nr:hypothetical protein [Gemmataceae bacterium]